MGSFILAIVLYPEVQHRAREELDRVVGRNRLPEYEDQADLPYISAIVKEVYRCVHYVLMIETFCIDR